MRRIRFILGGLSLLAAFGLAPYVFRNLFFRTVMGDLVPLAVVMVTATLTFRNAWDSRGHARLFWGLLTAGMCMWAFNQAGWAWVEVVKRTTLPDPFIGDIVLFLHVVPIMAAVVIRPHRVDARDGILPSTLNVLIL